MHNHNNPKESTENSFDAEKNSVVWDYYSFLRKTLLALFFTVLVFLIYSNTLHSPFVFDDLQRIFKNPDIRLTKLSLTDIVQAGFKGLSPNRPIVYISFALNYFFHQYDVMGYHLVNILIHLSNGILLYFFVKTTLSLPVLRLTRESQKLIPCFTALIWLVHPIQTQSVTYIVQRMNSMEAMFYLLSIFLYAKARLAAPKIKRIFLFTGSVFAGLLAIGSKEIAATLPFFIFLYEWYFFQDLNYIWIRRRFFIIGGLLVFLAVAAFMYMGASPLDRLLSSYERRDFTLTQRVLTEFRVVIFYLSLLLFPHPSRLNLSHDFLLSNSIIDPVTTLLSIFAIIGMTILAFYLARKERLLSFCILWFFGNLVIESSVISLEIIFEHRTYLPSMLLSLLFAMLIQHYLKPNQLRVPVVCILVVIFSLWTFERNSVWKSNVTLWRDIVEKSPGISRPHNNLGIYLMQQGKIDEAIIHFNKALQIKPHDTIPHNNLGNAMKKQGKIGEAIIHYRKALKIRPSNAKAHNNLGAVLLQEDNINEAMSHFNKALQIDPSLDQVHSNLGFVFMHQGDMNNAFVHFKKALQINPSYEKAHFGFGTALFRQGKLNEAISHYSEALRLYPDYTEAHISMGAALLEQGKLEEAIHHFSETLRIKPDHWKAHHSMGTALAKQGKLKDAVEYFSKALKIKPNYWAALFNLGTALVQQGRFDEAAVHFSRVLQIKPDFMPAQNSLRTVLQMKGEKKN